MEKKEYKTCTEIEGQAYLADASTWFENAPNSSMFGSVKSVARAAVAEFLANQDGKTLYRIIG